MTIYRGPGGGGNADSDAEINALTALSTEAEASATAAAASAAAASSSASAASTSASNAATSASNAASTAAGVTASASAASTSATNAASSASAASTSASNAASSASAASSSASGASSSASAASSSATAAASSATTAGDSAISATGSASAASTSASNAATSATNSANSATTASTQASNASTSATNAASSASTASTAATNASNSASAASTSATNASNSATSASSSASTATTQASNASTSATNAATSASTATTQAGIATTQASNASSSASSASTSASNASTSATNAAAAQTAAETARDQTLASFDSFDDRYLGAKTSDPTVDNDGNALVAGALYFNSVSGVMNVYTGSLWVAAYVSGTNFVAKAGDTMTGTLTATGFIGPLTGNASTATNVAYSGLTGTVPTWNQNTTGTATTATNQSGGTVSATSITYSTTLTGGTGVVNLGSGQVYKDASGNVGLATSSPRVRLDVRSDAVIAAPTPLASAVASGVLAIGDSVGSVVGLQLNGSSYDTYIQSRNMGAGSTAYNLLLQPLGGNVGIGTSSPAEKLDVSGNIRLSGSDTYLKFINPGGYDFSIRANSGNNLEFYSPEYSANPLMAITNNGNVGIGTSSPNAFGNRTFEVSAGANSAAYIAVTTNSNTIKGEVALDGGVMYISTKTSNPMVFRTADAERARIDTNGRMQVNGTTVVDVARISVSFNSADSTGIGIRATNGSGGTLMKYENSGGTAVGSITTNATLTVYNTTSDYRLKTVVGAVSGQGARIDALEPIEYTWNSNGLRTRGFLAHKFQEVYESSVTGTKDAVDADGKPVYQGMQASSSEVIADLVAEIQSLRKRLAAAGI